MASVDLSPETLARLEEQLAADLAAVRRVRELLGHRKKAVRTETQSSAPAPAPVVATGEVPVAASQPEPVNAAPAPVPAPVSPVDPMVAIPAPAPVPLPASVPVPVPPPVPAPPIDHKANICEAIGAMTGPFSIGAVKDYLRKRHRFIPEDRIIRDMMKKMAAAGTLRLVSTFHGRSGDVYEPVPPPAPPSDAPNPPA